MAQHLITTLQGLRDTGDVGQRLAERLLTIHARHVPFILGMFSLFRIFIKIGLLTDNEVSWPPHNRSELVALGYHSLGLNDEVLDLISLIPYNVALEQFPASVMLPSCTPMHYFGHLNADVTGPFYFEDKKYSLPAHVLRFTDGQGTGDNHLYNTLTANVIRWTYNDNPSLNIDGENPEAVPKHISATDVFKAWIGNFESLHWLIDPTMSDAGIDIEPEADSNGSDQYLHPRRSRQNQVNRHRAKKRTFGQHGWPGASFGAEPCHVALRAFNKQAETLERAVSNALVYPMEFDLYHPRVQDEPINRLTAFYLAAAGEDGVEISPVPLHPSMYGSHDDGLAASRDEL